MRNKKRFVSLSVLCAIVLCVGGVTTLAGDPFDKNPKHQLPKPDTKAPDQKKPVKVFILLGQSNMQGKGKIEPETTKGTLAYLTKKEGRYPHLLDADGKWTVRNDVWNVVRVADCSQGWLTPGCQGKLMGPELQFGYIMGQLHDEMVLLLKAAAGGRSLGYDFLPPGSEQYEVTQKDKSGAEKKYVMAGYKDVTPSWEVGTEPKPNESKGQLRPAGWQYDLSVAEIHKVLDNLKTFFPSYNGQGCEIAGFVWFHGWNDRCSRVYPDRNEKNLVQFIKSLRAEFKAPKAPFVIAACGFGGWDTTSKGSDLTLKVINAQLAVSGENGKYPEFAGNVKTTESRDFWRDASVSPTGAGYHYNGNAETYMEVGNAMGWAMAELLKKQPDKGAK